MRLFLLTLSFLALAAPAVAQDGDKKKKSATLTVTTSLGPINAEDERNLRARGKAPVGSKVTVRFYRGKKKLGSMRAKVRDGRYKAWKSIDRIGSYKVVVTAKTRTGSTISVTARLKYGPKAEAPTAPERDDED